MVTKIQESSRHPLKIKTLWSKASCHIWKLNFLVVPCLLARNVSRARFSLLTAGSKSWWVRLDTSSLSALSSRTVVCLIKLLNISSFNLASKITKNLMSRNNLYSRNENFTICRVFLKEYRFQLVISLLLAVTVKRGTLPERQIWFLVDLDFPRLRSFVTE